MNRVTDFEKDTLKGLLSRPKFLLSKYFYDENGSKIFQDIMRMPEYYLTDAEKEIFETRKGEIIDAFTDGNNRCILVELGAGDGMKTKILLSRLLEKKCDIKYIPVDISADAVEHLVKDLKKQMPLLKVEGKVGDYFELLGKPGVYEKSKKVFLFLGSNIGNFSRAETIDFLSGLNRQMAVDDMLFIGFDLKKEPEIILNAYNDKQGYTAAFNLNLLARINRELEADFRLDQFRHSEEYNPAMGTAKSYLISLKKQRVYLKKPDKVIGFEQGERIFTERSQKYDSEMIQSLAETTGFEIVRNFSDSRNYFVNSLWRKIC